MARKTKRSTKKEPPVWRKLGYDSSLELAVHRNSSSKLSYHSVDKLPYIIQRTYEPDFFCPTSDEPGKPLLVETKGNPTHWDRKAFLSFYEQYKDDFAIKVLLEKEVKIPGCKSMTNVDWCKKNGIPYAVGTKIPDFWLGPDKEQVSIA